MKVVRLGEVDNKNFILNLMECEVEESMLKKKELPARIKRFIAEVILRGNTINVIVK